MKFHGWELNDLDNMLPFEREIYVALLMEHLEEERQRIKKENEISWT